MFFLEFIKRFFGECRKIKNEKLFFAIAFFLFSFIIFICFLYNNEVSFSNTLSSVNKKGSIISSNDKNNSFDGKDDNTNGNQKNKDDGLQKEEEIEIIDGLVVIRELNKEIIEEKIEQGKEYLLRMIDKEENGAHKYYYATEDSLEERLHTIYTSSLVYALLNIYNAEEDPILLKQIIDSGDFILSMQNEEEGKGYGAFFYSYYLPSSREGIDDLDSYGRENKFVVGTTSKTIFTLIRLYNLTDNDKYLKSAKLGADWLLTMQESDGSIKPYLRYRDGKWYHGTGESVLYNGQVLSALSKIYVATGEKKYYEGAEKIAKRFAQKYEIAGRSFITGDYRSENPISNSWVAMSFIDFYRATKNNYYKDIIFEMMNLIISEQKEDPKNIIDYGQFEGSYSSSGNGWIAEVLCETHELCQKEEMEDCNKYKEALLKVIRWNMQYTYIKENSYFLKNPEMAKGGIFWDRVEKYIRTDSVCHGLNAYIGIMGYLSEDILLSIPD